MDKKDNYFKSKEFQDLLQSYEQSLQNGRPEYFGSDELSDIAEYYYNTGKQKEAIDVLDYAVSLHPGAAMPLVFRGRIALIDDKDIDTAEHYADMIGDQYDLDCLYLHAEIMIARGETDKANQFLHNSMERIDEDDMPDYVLDVATLFIDYNLPDLAEEWLKLSDEPDLLDYREVKARIAFSRGDYEQSEKIFDELLDEDPYSGHYWNSLASTQFMSNRINDSITSSEYSIAINPNDEEAILNKANGLFSLGNFTDAMEYYKRFLKLCPDEGSASLFIGNCLLNLGRAEEALPYYEAALKNFIEYDQSTIEVRQCLAFTLSQIGKTEEALQCLDKADSEKECNHSDISVVRGHIQLEHGMVKEAIKSFVSALQATAFSHEIFFRIAISVYDCGYPTIAYRMFKAYHEVHHEKGDEGTAYLAVCCRLLNQKEEYLKYLKTACEQNPLEARKVLGEYFPEGMNPNDYYSYEVAKQHE